MKSDIICLLTLQQVKGWGPKRINTIRKQVDVQNIKSSAELHSKLSQISLKFQIPSFEELNIRWNKAFKIIKKSKEYNIDITSIYDSNYPSILRTIDDAPLLLHSKGNKDLLNEPCVAIVGSRSPTAYGQKETKILTKKLVQNDFCIVSGLAEGIDSIAHKTTINNKGKTIAVLAHGLHTVYPAKHKRLASKILQNNGLLLSEQYIGTPYNKGFFIKRNRIQSGISKAVFIMESGSHGGTMRTAKYATKQKKLLFVLEPKNKRNYHSSFDGNVELLVNGALAYDDKNHIQEILKKINNNDQKTNFQKRLMDF